MQYKSQDIKVSECRCRMCTICVLALSLLSHTQGKKSSNGKLVPEAKLDNFISLCLSLLSVWEMDWGCEWMSACLHVCSHNVKCWHYCVQSQFKHYKCLGGSGLSLSKSLAFETILVLMSDLVHLGHFRVNPDVTVTNLKVTSAMCGYICG